MPWHAPSSYWGDNKLKELIAALQEGVHRTRQHHAIEHATLHVLAERYPQRTFAGYSDPLGFFVYGDVDSHALRHVVGDALLRLQAGEAHLAIHANCGTVLASTALLTTVAALLGAHPAGRAPRPRTRAASR